MITLDQIVSLEHKVETAIAKIDTLTRENAILRERCGTLEQENHDLHRNLMEFQKDQTQIEQGILNALNRLDSVENSVINTSESAAAVPGNVVHGEQPDSGEILSETVQQEAAPQEEQPLMEFDQHTVSDTAPVPDQPQNGQHDIF